MLRELAPAAPRQTFDRLRALARRGLARCVRESPTNNMKVAFPVRATEIALVTRVPEIDRRRSGGKAGCADQPRAEDAKAIDRKSTIAMSMRPESAKAKRLAT